MPFAEDQHPVGDFGPGCEHEPFRVSVRALAAGRDLHDLDTGIGQDCVKRFGELPGPGRGPGRLTMLRCTSMTMAMFRQRMASWQVEPRNCGRWVAAYGHAERTLAAIPGP